MALAAGRNMPTRMTHLLAVILSIAATLQAEELRWNVLGHPTAEKANAARKINELKFFNERLYIGYGDYGVNTGPTDVIYYDFAKKEFVTEFTVQEEAIVAYRELDGKLAIPGVDSTESWDKGNLYVLNADGWIKQRTVPNGVHVFDAVAWRNRWYVATGNVLNHDKAANEQLSLGAVMSSGDKGQSWRWEYTTPSEVHGIYRINHIVPYRDRLYAFPYAFRVYIVDRLQERFRRDLINLLGKEGSHQVLAFERDIQGPIDAMEGDGVIWRPADLFPGQNVVLRTPFVFKDSLCAVTIAGPFVATSGHYDLRRRGWPDFVQRKIYRYQDGKATEVPLDFTTIEDIVVQGDKLFLLILRRDGSVIGETADFEAWVDYKIPAEFGAPLSLEINGGRAFVGLGDGRIIWTELRQTATPD